MKTLTFKSENNFKSATINERESMFGNYENYFSVRFFDGTGTIQRNFKTKELAIGAVNKFINHVVVFEDTIEFYKNYNIHSWFQLNMPFIVISAQ